MSMRNGLEPMTAPGREQIPEASRGARVLVVDPDDNVADVVRRILTDSPHVIGSALDAEGAVAELDRGGYDILVSEVRLSEQSGLELLTRVRERDASMPVILVAAAPSIESAAEAVARGAFRYVPMSVEPHALGAAIGAAIRAREVARIGHPAGQLRTSRAELEQSLAAALQSLHMAYQPVVHAATRSAIGYEALMRSGEPSLPTPPAVLDAAEKLGTLHVLGRRVRTLVAEQLSASPEVGCMFVNLHAADLADPELYDPTSPLSRHSSRVILEITERASLETIADLDGRIGALRALGFRIAIDDLGAGYAGLSYFARLRPDIAKIDMSLVRGIDQDPVRQKVVRSLSSLAGALGMEVVAEGVETIAERDAVIRLGCTYVQGYVLARPGPPFPDARWTSDAARG